MTDEQINIAVAKIDGWDRTQNICGELKGYNKDDEWNSVPPYTESYDEIIPVIQRQDEETQVETMGYLFGVKNHIVFNATPLQLCVALLKAKGLYEN